MDQSDARRMIRRRAETVGIFAPIGNHTFRVTGIKAISPMAARWNTRRRWRPTKARARPSFMTVPRDGSPRTR